MNIKSREQFILRFIVYIFINFTPNSKILQFTVVTNEPSYKILVRYKKKIYNRVTRTYIIIIL